MSLVSKHSFNVNLSDCKKASVHDAVAPKHSLLAACVLDSVRAASFQQTDGEVPSAMMNWSDVVCQYTLPCLHSKMAQLATCSHVSTVKDPIVYLLSKTFPQRCLTRLYAAVSLRLFAGNREVRSVIKALVLCSLLGNYEHTRASSRPQLEVRHVLYNVMPFTTETQSGQHFHTWFDNLFVSCVHLVVFALRDYVVFAVEDSPSLLQHCRQLFDWDAFKATVNDTMNRVRAYIGFSFRLYSSPLRISLEHPRHEISTHLRDDFNALVEYGHQTMLTICYRRIGTSINSQLASIRKSIQLASLQQDKEELTVDSDESDTDDDDDDDDDSFDINTALCKHIRVDGYKIAVFDRQQRKRKASENNDLPQNKKQKNEEDDDIGDLSGFIPKVQYEAMKHIARRLLPFHPFMLQRCVSFFPCFGVDQPDTIDYIQRFIRYALERGATKKDLTRALMAKLLQHDRHAYNLLHATSEIVREVCSVRIVRSLPLHLWQHQIEAVQTRYAQYSVTHAAVLVEQAVLFRFCSVCDTVYSLTRDFHSVYKNDYDHGFRDAVVDYTTLEIYCHRDKQNHRGKCGEKPLTAVPILGQLLFCNGKHYMLCPQLGCGMVMAVYPNLSLYNERGPACRECTERIPRLQRQQQQQQQTKESKSVVSNDMCIMCIRPKDSTPFNTFMYPHGVNVCRKHHSHSLTEFVREHRLASKEETTKLIVQFIQRKRRERHEARQPMYKRELAKRKQAARANVRR